MKLQSPLIHLKRRLNQPFEPVKQQLKVPAQPVRGGDGATSENVSVLLQKLFPKSNQDQCGSQASDQPGFNPFNRQHVLNYSTFIQLQQELNKR